MPISIYMRVESERPTAIERGSKSLFGIAGMNIYDGSNARPRARALDEEKDVVKIDDGVLEHGPGRCKETGYVIP